MPRLTILQINDTHGYLESHQELFWDGTKPAFRQAGGYERISAYIKNARAENGGHLIALDSGDTIHGTYPAIQSKGLDFVGPLNQLGLDAWTGHWDFAYGPSHLKELTGKLHYPFLACNCYDKITDELFFKPYVMIERAGLRIGVIGIASTIIDKTMPAHFSEGVYFTIGNEELPGHISSLRGEGADIIIVLSHLGFPQDIKIAREVPGIDVILSGHTHNRLYEPYLENGAIIIQSGCHGSFIGHLDIDVEDKGIIRFQHKLVTVEDTLAGDNEMRVMIETIMAPHREYLDEKVGQTGVDLHRDTSLTSPMDDLLLEAIMMASETAIAFSNGWRYGAPIPKGDILRNDLWNIIPVNPPVSTVVLTGAEIYEMMEQNLENTFSSDPYKQMGGYVKRFSGLQVIIKLENPKGTRIQEIFHDHVKLDKFAIYKVSYVTEQGVPKSLGRKHTDINVTAIDALEHYLKNIDCFLPSPQEKIVVV